MSKEKPMEIKYAPDFSKQMGKILADLNEEEQAELKAGLAEALERMRSNPYAGTPIGVSPIVVFINWAQRVIYDWRFNR